MHATGLITERQALRRSILDDPFDHTARLVYADHLDEYPDLEPMENIINGPSRADLIRSLLGSDLSSRNWPDSGTRLTGVEIGQHTLTWEWCGGFIWAVRYNGRDLASSAAIQHVNTLFSRHPIVWVDTDIWRTNQPYERADHSRKLVNIYRRNVCLPPINWPKAPKIIPPKW